MPRVKSELPVKMGDQQVEKKQFVDSNLGRDYISNLPQPIKENILAHLRTEEAVRTCVLSKEWRYAWCTVPRLKIFEKYNIDENSNYDCGEYVDIVLSYHKGPINKFTLHMDEPDFEDLDNWFSILGSKGLKDLTLYLGSLNDCELPPSFFSYLVDLTNLKLIGCELEMPEFFKGFKMLRKVELESVTFISSDLEKLVSSCPLLEDLILVDEDDCLGDLVIRSQSLGILTVIGNFKHLLLETPKMFSFSIFPEEFIVDREEFKEVKGEFQPIINISDHDPENWCRFTVLCEWDGSAAPRKLPIQLNHLTQIVVDIDLSNEDDHLAALCLFKSSPRLQALRVNLYTTKGLFSNGFWESEAGDDLFGCLKTITIHSMRIGGAIFILEFIEFVLRTAPVLENMSIEDVGFLNLTCTLKTPRFLENAIHKDCKMKQLKLDMMTIFKVLKFPRLSNKATVAFQEGCMCYLLEKEE